jgi:hypothetical protein
VSRTTAALASVEETASGVASGLLSTFVQVGGAIGVAALAGAVLAERAKALLATGHTPVVAQQGELQVAFLIAPGVALAGSIVAFFALDRERANVTAAEATPLQAVASYYRAPAPCGGRGGAAGGCPPVGVAGEAHEGGHADSTNEGGANHDRYAGADDEHLDEADLRRSESEEVDRQQRDGCGDDPSCAGGAAGDGLRVGSAVVVEFFDAGSACTGRQGLRPV